MVLAADLALTEPRRLRWHSEAVMELLSWICDESVSVELLISHDFKFSMQGASFKQQQHEL
jgi:hypothetical protein